MVDVTDTEPKSQCLKFPILPKIETSHNRPIPTPSTIFLRLSTALATAPPRTSSPITNAATTYVFIAPAAYKPFILLYPLDEMALQPFKRTPFASGCVCDPKGPQVTVVAPVVLWWTSSDFSGTGSGFCGANSGFGGTSRTLVGTGSDFV